MDSYSLFGNIKNDAQVAFLEFIGTTIFLTLAMGGIQAVKFANHIPSLTPDIEAFTSVVTTGQLLHIAFSMGFSLLISVWLFYRVTGGMFNPAASTALLLIGAIKPVRWALCCASQLAGGIAASALILALLPGPLLVSTTPAPGVNLAQAVFIEAFMTCVLVLTVLMLAVEKHYATPIAPIGVGLSLFTCHLWGVIYTGASINTARSFGPAVVAGFHSSHWVYWVGPFIGSLVATAFYYLLKHIDYTHNNPGQDAIHLETFMRSSSESNAHNDLIRNQLPRNQSARSDTTDIQK